MVDGGRRVSRGWEMLPRDSLGRDRNHLPQVREVVPEFDFTLSENHPITVLGGEQHQFF